MTTNRPTTAANAADIVALQQWRDEMIAAFGENSQVVARIQQQLDAATATANQANETANLAIARGKRTHRLLEALGLRVAEDHDTIVTLLGRLERLEQSGGSPSNFAALVAAGFNEAERAAIMTLAGQSGDSDDQFVAALVMMIRSEVRGLGDVVADHSNLLTAQAADIEELKKLPAEVNSLREDIVEVRALASVRAGNFNVPDWAWVVGLIVGLIAWWGFASADFPTESWMEDWWFAPLMGLLFWVVTSGVLGVISGRVESSASAALASASVARRSATTPPPAPAGSSASTAPASAGAAT